MNMQIGDQFTGSSNNSTEWNQTGNDANGSVGTDKADDVNKVVC